MNILLIAGHGQGDPGAIGSGYYEADLTRELVPLIKSKLEGCANVVIADTRFNYYNNLPKLPLTEVDYVLEIHFNACVQDVKGDGKTTGTEIYVTTEEQGVSVEENIVKNIGAIGFKNRGVKRTNFAVINYIKKKGISSALLETCFIDDLDDIKLYFEKKNEIASAIADGIIMGFNLENKSFEENAESDIGAEKHIEILVKKGIITNKALWVEKCERDVNVYWLVRKCAQALK